MKALPQKKKDYYPVAFRPEYFDLVGDINAALLMSQIHYWYMPNEKGKSRLKVQKYGTYWLAKSHTDWWKEIRLTRRQVDRAISILTEKCLIQVEVFRFDGLTTRHIIGTALAGVPLQKRPELGGTALLGQFASPTKGIRLHLEGEALTETTAETTAETKEGSLPLAAATPQEGGKTDFSKTGKETEEKQEKEVKGGQGKNLQEILAEAAKKKEARKPVVNLSARGMAQYWRELCIAHGHGVEFHPATLAELGMWSQMLKLEKERLPVVVEEVVKHWDSYALDVLHSVGDKGKPTDPSVPYLRKYLTNAVNWFLLRKEPKGSHKVPQVPVTVPVLPKKKIKVETSDGPVDWAALEAEHQQGKIHGSSD